jgi:FkbM family methyltransferase
MVEDLVFDVGMHNGDDTEEYLARKYRVVAIEANPTLVEAAKKRFSRAIAAGQLVIEGSAIFNREGATTFWVNDEKDEWSALEHDVGGRLGTRCHEISVPCTRLSTMFKKYGVPFFLKSDIERGDRYGFEDLNPADLPRYVAVEAHEFNYLLLLWKYGYRKFKVVDQMRLNSTFPLLSNEHVHTRILKRAFWYGDRVKNKFGKNLRYKPGSSGPLGEESEGPWLPIEDVAYNFLHHSKNYGNRGNMDHRSWFDFHAKLG